MRASNASGPRGRRSAKGPSLALTALVIERFLGYPDHLHRWAPHPVTWIGEALTVLERRWNRPDRSQAGRKAAGVLALFLVAGGAAAAGGALTRLLKDRGWGLAAQAVVSTPGLAQRSLYEHVLAVARPLERGDLVSARRALARIVGRDTLHLTRSQIAAAALESLAESFNDGVVAPAFWLTFAGLPGLYAYKAVNTADSMIGHKENRWRSFGWASARTDDLLNLAPARLAGVLIALAAGRGWRQMWRDAPLHASPNAGWPEAAMAGALGVQLGGPAHYDGVLIKKPFLGSGPPPEAEDLQRGLALYTRACALLWLSLGVMSWRR